MSQSLCQNYIHIIYHISFSEPVNIPLELEAGLHAYLAEICKSQNSPALVINGTKDHVHILCQLSKKLSIVELLMKLKSNSSRWMKVQDSLNPYLEKFSWQKGYGSFPVSASKLDIVQQYILNQKEHHKKLTFKEEYLMFLDKYHVEYNDKYLWD
ncbi:transposase [Lentisphaera profundi]|uniref:Transposase n=1 Tax=Lentisphaera profundi TaxID=1658616 RepID=A0ABY7VY30_9BACT|nr:transposase [Lentisphaera profundi]WDE96973.1 transposase [Lentisphaera profundi]